MISRFPVIDVAGNHDVWGVDSFSSKANVFLDHSFIFNRSSIKNENDFTIKKVSIFNLTFIFIKIMYSFEHYYMMFLLCRPLLLLLFLPLLPF